MQKPFTTLSVSRFLEREAVLATLRATSLEAGARCPGVVAIYLFGSLAHGIPTPRSDADLLVVCEDTAHPDQVYDCCLDAFLSAPVPVDLFVRTSAQVQAAQPRPRGVVEAALHRSLQLYPPVSDG